MSAKITIVAGLGYSDEGKGHVVQLMTNDIMYANLRMDINVYNEDEESKKKSYLTKHIEYLYDNFEIIMRCNGSWFSSHQIDYENKFKCFHLPSVMEKDKILIIGPGMFVCPKVLIQELSQEFRTKQEIYVCEECFVIEDDVFENYIEDIKVGTLGSGVRNTCIKKLKDVVNENNYPELIKYLINDDEYFNLMYRKNILVEGSHGYLIDYNFGNCSCTTSINITPSEIMSLTKYSPNCCKKIIFVAGLILMSLSTHPEHKTFEYFKLNHLEKLIPDNIKYDYVCCENIKRNLGPFNIDIIQNIIKYYDSCDIYFTFFDIVDKIGIFYYIEEGFLRYIKKCDNTTDEFQKYISDFLLSKFERNILICPKPFEK